MNSDPTAIQAAYATALQKLYAALFEAYVTAAGDAAQEQQADDRFTVGLGFARKSRDHALELVA